MNRFRGVLFSICVGACALRPAVALAFAEDVCYPAQSSGAAGAPVTCNPLPAACAPAGVDSAACRAAALVTFAASTATRVDGRSAVHTDATHLLAQAVGFSASDAYWIAAYDEAVDLGVFQPRDFSGQPVGEATSNIDGFVRTNAGVGGTFFHFNAPRVGGTDGLHPTSQDPHVEPVLAHVRRWAVQGTGNARVECTGSFTTQSAGGDWATGSQCYVLPSGAAGTVGATIAAIGSVAAPLPTISTGLQVVTTAQPPQPAIDSQGFDNVVGGSADRVRDARLGIYLHVLADRVSHHVCVDQSRLTGPNTGATPTFYFDLTNGECTQDVHALRHIWETGVRFSQLSTQDRTTEAALSNVYDELVTFAQARGVLRPGAATAPYKSAVMAAVVAALQVPDAVARMTAVANAACARGYAPFPGTVTCAP